MRVEPGETRTPTVLVGSVASSRYRMGSASTVMTAIFALNGTVNGTAVVETVICSYEPAMGDTSVVIPGQEEP